VSKESLVQTVHHTGGNASGFVLGEVVVGSEQRCVSECEASSWYSDGDLLVLGTHGFKVAVQSLFQRQFQSHVQGMLNTRVRQERLPFLYQLFSLRHGLVQFQFLENGEP